MVRSLQKATEFQEYFDTFDSGSRPTVEHFKNLLNSWRQRPLPDIEVMDSPFLEDICLNRIYMVEKTLSMIPQHEQQILFYSSTGSVNSLRNTFYLQAASSSSKCGNLAMADRLMSSLSFSDNMNQSNDAILGNFLLFTSKNVGAAPVIMEEFNRIQNFYFKSLDDTCKLELFSNLVESLSKSPKIDNSIYNACKEIWDQSQNAAVALKSCMYARLLLSFGLFSINFFKLLNQNSNSVTIIFIFFLWHLLIFYLYSLISR